MSEDFGKLYVVTALSTDQKTEGTRVYIGRDWHTHRHPLQGKLFSENHKVALLKFIDASRAECLRLSINPHTITVKMLEVIVGDVGVQDDPAWYAAVNETAFPKLNPIEIEALGLTGRALHQHIIVRTGTTADDSQSPTQEVAPDEVDLVLRPDINDTQTIAETFRSKLPRTVRQDDVAAFVRFAHVRGCFSYDRGGNLVLNESRTRKVLSEFFTIRNIDNSQREADQIIEALRSNSLPHLPIQPDG